MDKYSMIPYLNELYDKRNKDKMPIKSNFFAWQDKKRKELAKLLTIEKLSILKIDEKKNKKEKNGYIITQKDLLLNDGTVMPVYFGRAKSAKPPFRPIIIYHGHADGAKTLFGDGMTKDYQDYALEFMHQGYLVVAPDQRGFGGRLGPAPIFYNGYTRSCRQLAFNLMLQSKTILGERVSDGFALVDYLGTGKDLNLEKIIVTGNSGGGTVAMLHAALDKRVSASIVGSAFCEYKHSIMDLSHCECNYVPGLLNHFQEIWQVGALVAPRPMLIIHGKKDKIFPVKYVKIAFHKLEDYYGMANTSKDALQLHLHSGAHRYDHGKVFSFLKNI